MTRRLLRLLLVLTCVSALVALTPLSARAVAQAPMTITVGARGTLQARVVATVPVQIICGPLEVDPNFNEQLGQIEQAAGQAIAHGSGVADQPFVCDGTPHANSFTMLADPSGPPFHGGNAAVSVHVRVCDATFSTCASGDSGIQIVKLSG